MPVTKETFDNVRENGPDISVRDCISAYWRTEKRINHRMAAVIPSLVLILLVHTYFAWASMPIVSGIVCSLCLVACHFLSHIAGICHEMRENQALFHRAINRLHNDVLNE